MRTSITLLAALIAITPAFCKPAAPSSNNATLTTCVQHPASPTEQQEIFERYSELLYLKRTPAPAFVYIATNEIQHNPYALDGAAAAFAIVNTIFTNSSNGIEVLHQAFHAPFGWVHWRLDGFYSTPASVVDIYRFEGACIVEHWDTIQQVPTNAINPHPLF
ncbi:hypothetical protein C8F04DRAFT_1104923 [Mycena alexandri]|uniref:SnoaL-like domain-containing protein n=1 Tax=Mycena alexandri TaxID=1745969 RepID=A0AAD6SUU9_9AGAR|nr:hypothetical protein C8F04DRAFT_1104923 [Mycena alexandri]